MWGALSDEGTGLQSTIAAGSRQSRHFRARVLFPGNSVTQLHPQAFCNGDSLWMFSLYISEENRKEESTFISSTIACLCVRVEICSTSRCIAMDVSAICYNVHLTIDNYAKGRLSTRVGELWERSLLGKRVSNISTQQCFLIGRDLSR
jgi:hypothetical protein